MWEILSGTVIEISFDSKQCSYHGECY